MGIQEGERKTRPSCGN